MERGSGLLVHISELPSKYGIGNFGSEARKFVRFLSGANQKYWQILPLNPTSFGDSPYQSFSAFALNPYFIDLHQLVKKGYLSKEDLKHVKFGNKSTSIDYGKLYQERYNVLRKAFKNAYDIEKINDFLEMQKLPMIQKLPKGRLLFPDTLSLNDFEQGDEFIYTQDNRISLILLLLLLDPQQVKLNKLSVIIDKPLIPPDTKLLGRQKMLNDSATKRAPRHNSINLFIFFFEYIFLITSLVVVFFILFSPF